MHTSFLGLKPGMRIVDVGCGTGDFTRYLASLILAKSTIIGVDTRAASLRAAERETKNAKLDGSISYRKGDAYNIPIENGWADLACCRTVLMHLTDPLKAVREMARGNKEGRDGCRSRAWYNKLCLHSRRREVHQDSHEACRRLR